MSQTSAGSPASLSSGADSCRGLFPWISAERTGRGDGKSSPSRGARRSAKPGTGQAPAGTAEAHFSFTICLGSVAFCATLGDCSHRHQLSQTSLKKKEGRKSCISVPKHSDNLCRRKDSAHSELASAGPFLAEQDRSCPLCPFTFALELLPPDRHPHAPQPRCVTNDPSLFC